MATVTIYVEGDLSLVMTVADHTEAVGLARECITSGIWTEDGVTFYPPLKIKRIIYSE
jgi:hypothetical protein